MSNKMLQNAKMWRSGGGGAPRQQQPRARARDSTVCGGLWLAPLAAGLALLAACWLAGWNGLVVEMMERWLYRDKYMDL